MSLRSVVLIAAVLATGCSGGEPATSTGGSSGSSTSASGSTGSASSGSSGSGGSSTSSGSSGSSSSGSSGSASSSSSSGSSTGSSGASQAQPFVTSVSVEGASAAEIRQGGTAIVHIQGTNLENASAVQLGSTPLTINSDTTGEIVGGFSAPHAATLGTLDLAVSTPGGSTTFSNAVSITAIMVDPTGDDSANGVPSAPFQTLSHALAVSASGDSVLLMPGTYPSDLESFPTGSAPTDYLCNVAGGLSLSGVNDAGANPLLLEATDAGSAPLVLCGGASLSNLDVQGFRDGIVVTNGAAQIFDVHQTGAAHDGLYVDGVTSLANIAIGGGTANDSSFDDNGNAGVEVVNSGTFTGGGFDVRNNAYGILSTDALTLTLRFANLDANQVGLSATGRTLVALGPRIEVSDNAVAGIDVQATRNVSLDGLIAERNGQAIFAHGHANDVTMSGSFVHANGVGLGIDTYPDAGAFVAVGTSQFIGNGRGIQIRGAPQTVSLNATTNGANTVQGNAANLDVDVPASAIISMRGVVFDGTDGGAFPDATPTGGENVPWVFNGITQIDANGLTQAPLIWDPDAGEGPFNYLLFDGGGQIQF